MGSLECEQLLRMGKKGQLEAMRESLFYTLKRSSPLLISMGLGGLAVVGALFALSKAWMPVPTPTAETTLPSTPQTSRVPAYSFQSATVRRLGLESLATQGSPLEQQQARFILGADAVRAGDGKMALRWLEGLEQRYAVLTPNILALRAQAYALNQDQGNATELWKQVIQQFPSSAAAGEAYFALGKQDPQAWDQAIATLPAHPRTVEIALERLKKQPKNPALLRLVAQYGLHLPDYKTYLDRWVQIAGPKLTPQDWQIVGFGYWEKQQYKPAGLAYSKAVSSSRNAYRAGRGLQLGDESTAAIAAYEKMIAAFPSAPETPRALIRLADLTDDNSAAVARLDPAITLAVRLNRPEDAADALARKARRLKAVNPAQSAAAETQLFSQFSQTDAAATLRWQKAWAAGQSQQWATAQKWAAEIAQSNPESEPAPKALFWAGKWADRLGQTQERQQHFTQLWQRYPQSYYAWRSSSLSGMAVGDFQSIRGQQVVMTPPTARLPLSAGSPLVQALYTLGEGKAAWEAWQLEFHNRQTPSIPEQLTDGLLRLQVGEYLDGLYMLTNVRDRVLTEPEQYAQRSTVQALHQDPRYWQALYPLPYWSEVQSWSAAQSLNPVLTLALIRQESRFQPAIRSVAGAMGLMQLMPETAAEVAAQVPLKAFDLKNPNDNIHLGTRYLSSTFNTYQDNAMLAIASYNAGPGAVAGWLKTLNTSDADIFIETIPFDETQNYVKSVLENYWNYVRLYGPQRLS
ncbi:MAG TPA: transglycosylase SLT domain-containing protein [Stenomitos sp.]